MERISICAKIREKLGSRASRILRKSSFTPAVLYGKTRSQAVQLDKENLLKLARVHFGENIIFDMSITKDRKLTEPNPVLIKEVQYDPLTEEVQHIDFLRISLITS